jgi:hypothetical protein
VPSSLAKEWGAPADGGPPRPAERRPPSSVSGTSRPSRFLHVAPQAKEVLTWHRRCPRRRDADAVGCVARRSSAATLSRRVGTPPSGRCAAWSPPGRSPHRPIPILLRPRAVDRRRQGIPQLTPFSFAPVWDEVPNESPRYRPLPIGLRCRPRPRDATLGKTTRPDPARFVDGVPVPCAWLFKWL